MSGKKWTWATVAVAVALLGTLAVPAAKPVLSPISAPGWTGWCSICSQNELQAIDVRYIGREMCTVAVWFADVNENGRLDGSEFIAHESVLSCTPGKEFTK